MMEKRDSATLALAALTGLAAAAIALAPATLAGQSEPLSLARTGPATAVRVDPAGGAERERPAAVADTLTLAEALRAALSRNPDVEAARARISGETAARWADWGAFLPDVTGRADFDRTNATRVTFQGEEGSSKVSPEPIDFTRKTSTQSLSLEWRILDGGRRFLDLKEGAARLRATEHRLAASERAVVTRVKRAYFEAVKQQRLASVAERQLAARREELEFTRQRFEGGQATRTDLLGARVEVGEAELALLDARDRLGEERRRLRREMGARRSATAATRPLEDAEVLPDAGALRVSRLVESALASDPEIRASRADARAATAATASGWTAYVPEITAGYSRALSESGGAEASFFELNPTDSFGTIGLTISWNVFDGFERRERVGRAQADVLEAKAEERRRALEIEKRVADLVSELRRRAERLEVLERNFELSRERLELARTSYEAGIRAFDELQIFIDEARTAERTLFSERYDYLKAWADLEELVGGLGGGRALP